MSKIDFDLVKLEQGGINVKGSVNNFNSYEDYFIELEKFANESKDYLSAYTVEAVLNDEKVRNDFRAELKAIRNRLMSLGITYPVSTLKELDYEAGRSGGESLSRWLDIFNTETGKMAECVSEARIAFEDDLPVNEEKPLILAADDKPELLTAVVNMLGDRFKVMASTNGRSVLKLIEKHPPDLFLLDIEMPVMDGYELAAAIRRQARFAQTPIIFLTSKNTRTDVVMAVKRGGNDYVVKPVNKDLLINKILRNLEIE